MIKLNRLNVVYIFSVFLMLISCKEEKNVASIINNDTQVDRVINSPAKLGEGAIWNDRLQELWWIDIEKHRLHTFKPSSKMTRMYDMGERIGTVVPAENEKAIVALQTGIHTYDFKTGEKSFLSDFIENNTTTRYNDGKCDPQGRLWVGSMHLDQIKGAADLFCLDKRKFIPKIDSVTISNGICWTKDEKTMYYIDTPSGEIKAFDYDSKTGNISMRRIAVKIPESLGYPDGMTIDENDQLWVGLWNGDGIGHFDPITGKLIRKYPIPAHNVTSCAFGGENLDILYVTSSNMDMTKKEKEKYPYAGCVFSLKPGVKGVKTNYFVSR